MHMLLQAENVIILKKCTTTDLISKIDTNSLRNSNHEKVIYQIQVNMSFATLTVSRLESTDV